VLEVIVSTYFLDDDITVDILESKAINPNRINSRDKINFN